MDRLFDQVILLECNLDDITAEELGYVLERLLEDGALDAWFTSIQMKKNRPGTLLSVLVRPGDASRLRALLLSETTTLGVRSCTYDREIARRTTDIVMTEWGPVRRKIKWLGSHVASIKPEYDDCARAAKKHAIPLRSVIEAAKSAPTMVEE